MVLRLIPVILLAGCALRPPVVEIQEVETPIFQRRTPPAELVKDYSPPRLPEFVKPDDPKASSALTRDGELVLKLLINDLVARDRAWRAWATATERKENDQGSRPPTRLDRLTGAQRR